VSQVVRDANVYFLPQAPAAQEPPRRSSVWRRLRARLDGGLWRMRFAMAGIRLALRRPRSPLFADDEAVTVLSAQRAELIERRPRLVPAQIIDFRSARARLRPLAATR
jgi:hypothetical protein